MSRINPSMSREEVAALVCAALERHGIRVVLSGGAVVSIYSEEAYVSYDLDFVRTGLARRVDPVMKQLGFRSEGRHWRHPDTAYWVDFPAGPPGVGDLVLSEFAERDTPFGRLRLLTPTDCVMDRLASFFHWNDAESLEQAVLVARRQPIDLARIEAWAEQEGAGRQLEAFRERLTRGK